jgi:virginiamycin B lyase
MHDRPALRAVRNLARLALLATAFLALTATFTSRADAFVYWGNFDGTVGRANLDGTNVEESFIAGGDNVCGVAVNATHIYWANVSGTGIGRANLDGTGVDQSLIDATDPCGVAVSATHVYWANSSANTIGRANLNGTGAGQNFVTGASEPCGVAVDGTYLYWANDGSDSIGRAELSNPATADQGFITGADSPCGVAVNATHLYWTNTFGVLDTIGRASLGNPGGANQSFITSAPDSSPCGVATNAKHIYWASRNGSIGRANLNGTGVDPSFIASGDSSCGVALDARSSPPPTPPSPPSNDFSFGKVKKNRKKGTAKLTVIVPGPGEVDLAKNKKVKGAQDRSEAAGEMKIAIKPKRKAKRKLKTRGKVKVNAEVTYTPNGGHPNTQSKRIGLRKRG